MTTCYSLPYGAHGSAFRDVCARHVSVQRRTAGAHAARQRALGPSTRHRAAARRHLTAAWRTAETRRSATPDGGQPPLAGPESAIAEPVPAGGQEITPRADRHDLSAREVSNALAIGQWLSVEGGLSGPARTR